MTPDQAQTVVGNLVAAFQGRQETVKAYVIAVLDFEYVPMLKAAEKAIRDFDRLPSVRKLLGLYYAERRAYTAAGSTPCAPCQREDGYRLSEGGTLYPPTAAVPPYVPESFVSDENGRMIERVWKHEPMCHAHGSAYVEHLWREHKPDLVERACTPRPDTAPAA